MFPNGGVPFGMGAVGGTYDPHEARMDMRPQGGPMNGGGRPQIRTPLLPRIQQEDGSQVVHSLHASGELPVIQDLTPNLTQDENSQPQNEEEFGSRNGQVGGPDGSMDVQMAPIMAPPVTTQGGFRGGPWGGGRGRDTFSSEAHKFRPERRHDKTLVVEKIPEDKMSLEHVNGWFKRFGTVTNVAIDVAKAKALISFSNHDEAHAAWKSEDAVFNNRFVKLFWHRPMEGHGQAGARMLAASAPLVANMAKETPVPVPVSTAAPSAAPTTSVTSRKASTPSAAASALAAKQQLLEQQIAEQRSLMASLETASSEEKKQIMARLRKLGEEMKPMPAGVPLAATAPSQAPKIRATPTSRPDDHERKERERLDKELELHHASLAVEGGAESTEDLKAKLEKLKAEVCFMSVHPPNLTDMACYHIGS
jgi:RNA-binding protein 26